MQPYVSGIYAKKQDIRWKQSCTESEDGAFTQVDARRTYVPIRVIAISSVVAVHGSPLGWTIRVKRMA